MSISTQYMGLRLASPVIVSSCSLSKKIANINEMENSGAGAIILPSLFEEQIKAGNQQSSKNLQQYISHLISAKSSVAIPIIASINGVSDKSWIDYASEIEQAGADGLELNIFFIPADFNMSPLKIEKRVLDIVRKVRKTINIPLAVKLSPYFSALGNMSRVLEDAGADAFVLFNRFYQPDFDIESLKVTTSLNFSSAHEIRLPLLWISLLHGRIKSSLGATSGVENYEQVVKYILAGADAVMLASTLYKNGIGIISQINNELEEWMTLKNFSELSDFKGLLSQKNIKDPASFERSNYIEILRKS
jgi:dihydroorotate dehydrogenase (fumarate)